MIRKKIKNLNDPTIKREKALQGTLRKLNKNNIFSGNEYSEIARLYGTPNIHKSFSSGSIPPVRPIVSSEILIIINSPSILVLYFHHIFPQIIQPKTVLLP